MSIDFIRHVELKLRNLRDVSKNFSTKMRQEAPAFRRGVVDRRARATNVNKKTLRQKFGGGNFLLVNA